MILCKFINIVFLVLLGIVAIESLEQCPNSSIICRRYCCKSYRILYCCNSCKLSYQIHPGCRERSTISVSIILGTIVAVLLLTFIISLIVSICCGCVCSSKTGIHRRNHVIPSEVSNLTVTNPYFHETNDSFNFSTNNISATECSPHSVPESYPYPPPPPYTFYSKDVIH